MKLLMSICVVALFASSAFTQAPARPRQQQLSSPSLRALSPFYKHKAHIAYDAITRMDREKPHDETWIRAKARVYEAQDEVHTSDDAQLQIYLLNYFGAREGLTLQFIVDSDSIRLAPQDKVDAETELAKKHAREYGEKEIACLVIIERELDIPNKHTWKGDEEKACITKIVRPQVSSAQSSTTAR